MLRVIDYVKGKVSSQVELLFIAMSFYSRLPVPHWLAYTPMKLQQCGRYFPLVGWILAGLFIVVFYLLTLLLSGTLALAGSMAVLIWLTGAFHEDGFADFCDGFGGGYNKEQILHIMVDSRIGTYGAVGLLMMILIRFLALEHVSTETSSFAGFFITIWLGVSLSRFMAYSYTADLNYVRISSQDALTASKSAFMQEEKSNKLKALGIAGFFGLSPLCLLPWQQALTILSILLLIRFIFGRYLLAKIGGYTGDCLGAAQQLFEVSIYLILGANIWNSI